MNSNSDVLYVFVGSMIAAGRNVWRPSVRAFLLCCHTFPDYSANMYKRQNEPTRRLSTSGVPHIVAYSHLDQTDMDQTSGHRYFIYFRLFRAKTIEALFLDEAIAFQ